MVRCLKNIWFGALVPRLAGVDRGNAVWGWIPALRFGYNLWPRHVSQTLPYSSAKKSGGM